MKSIQETSTLIREAAEWRLMSALFECPVGDWKLLVKGLANEIDDRDLKKATELAQQEASEGIYHSIFGPGGPAPAREISYRDWTQPGYLLSELRAFYGAFSYQPTIQETPDHIAVETAFVAYLKLKEAYALESGDIENAEITARAANTFIDEHLTKIAERIATALANSGLEHLALASSALFKRVGPDKDNKNRPYLPVFRAHDEDLIQCASL